MIYLDNAATTFPKPESVYTAVEKCMREYAANPGRSGHKLALEAARVIFDTRELIADFFRISDPAQVVYTSNCTEALNLAIKGILQPGDHVVTSSMEHNSVLRPLHALHKNGVSNTVLQCDGKGMLDPQSVKDAIQPNTRMVILTHASNVSGTLMPVEEIGMICRERDVVFLLDAAQTAGVYDIDVEQMHIDMLAVPGHKGLMGLQGTGFLYIGKGLHPEPLREGGTGSQSEEAEQPQIMPDRYESGTLNTPGIAGLGAGLKFIAETGMNKIREHEMHLTQMMLEGLLRIPGVNLYGPVDSQKQAAVIAMNIAGMDSTEAAYLLDSKYGICVRSGMHCAPLAHRTLMSFETGVVRFSFGFFNTKDEITEALDAIREITRTIK